MNAISPSIDPDREPQPADDDRDQAEGGDQARSVLDGHFFTLRITPRRQNDPHQMKMRFEFPGGTPPALPPRGATSVGFLHKLPLVEPAGSPAPTRGSEPTV